MAVGVKEYVTDRAITERATAFEPPAPGKVGAIPGVRDSGTPIRLDGEFLDNGDLILRMFAPKGSHVKATFFRKIVEVELADRGDGVFEGVLPCNPKVFGPKTVTFTIDGVEVVHPYMPVMHYMNRVVNYVEFPDFSQEYVLMRDVPHGTLSREVYFSKAIGNWVRCYVYTPPGYMTSGIDYPVLYLQHGAGENETDWWTAGKLPHILDNLLADGKCVPFVVVMNNGMLKAPHESLVDDFDGMEGILTTDCREFIEQKYRVKTDKWHRALAGLSLGSMLTSYVGFRHPELYGYLGIFSGGLRRRDHHNSIEESEYLDTLRNYDFEHPAYKLIFMSKGDAEGMPAENKMDADFLAECGIDKLPSFVRKEYTGGYAHEWGTWRATLHDFAQLIFRE